MSAPVKKCEVCDDTGSTSANYFGPLDCTHCSAADERVAMGKELGPMTFTEEIYARRAYQLGKAAAQPQEDIERPTDYDIIMMACEIALQDDVWEINDADLIPFVRRCIAAAAPVVPVAAQPVIPADPRCGACLGSGWVSRDADIGTEQECCSCDGTGKSDDPAPSLEAQPAGEVIPAEKLCALLPGTYYMDQPDGGSVTVLEQVERMAKDAARYHWLCKVAFDSSMDQEQINKEVDAAMAQGEKQ